ncbi:MAG: InlB B-repeat-containing protein, partial [Atopobiaceae bacterium]|nr:InlB B-repeat-containing protein [Atopobiaceae bacterium]
DATVKKGAYTLPGCGFTPPAGKYFVSWDVNGTTVAVGKNVAVSGSVSAKAMWEDYVKVSFDANGGTGSMEPMTMSKGRHNLPDCDFVPPEGKRFSYWTIEGNDGARLDASKPQFEVWDNAVLKANWVPANWGADVTIAYGSATVNESVTLEHDVTWTIEEGCTLTVNNTIDVQDGCSLTVTGGGTLIVQGTNGKEGMPGTPGHDGLPAIRGTIVVLGGNVNLSGGAGGKGKDGVMSSQNGSNGGDGGTGVEGSLTVRGGNVSVTGGTGGTGGAYIGPSSHGGSGRAKDGIDGQAVTGTVDYGFSEGEGASALQSSTGDENAWDVLERGAACTVRYLRCTVPLAVTFDPGAANGVEGDMAPQVFCYDTARPLLPAAYTRESYDFTGWNTKADGTGVTYLDEQSISITGNVTLYAQWAPDPAHFSVNQAGTEYTIHTAGGWGVFCDALQDNETYNRFSGKTVKLGEDITATRMAGGENHDFCGTFDGNGKTLTFNYGGTDSYRNEQYIAPFRYVSNVGSAAATIRDLRVAGDVYTSAKHAAGLVSRCWGTVSIENCRSSVSIHSSVSGDGTHAGFVAENNCSSLNITGCVFDGKLLTTGGTTSCGGFVGYGGTKVNISDSLYAPDALVAGETEVLASESATFNRTASTIANCYYTRKLGAAQGKAKRSVTAGEYVTVRVALAGEAMSYSVSGITAYGGGGLSRGDDLFYGNGDEVDLTLGHDRDGYDLIGYNSSAGMLSGNDADGYVLTMPDSNVTVSATFMEADQTFYAWVYGHSLTLEGTIGVNAYLILGGDVKAHPSDYQVEFWRDGALVSATKVSEGKERTEKGYDLRGFAVTAVAKEM